MKFLLQVLKVISWIIYAILTFACIVLAFGFVLLLFDANPDAGFTEFIYSAGRNFMNPFYNLIDSTELANGGIIYWSALVAIAVYLVIMWVVSLFMSWLSGRIYEQERKEAAAQTAPAQQSYSSPAATPSSQQPSTPPSQQTPTTPPEQQPAAAPPPQTPSEPGQQ